MRYLMLIALSATACGTEPTAGPSNTLPPQREIDPDQLIVHSWAVGPYGTRWEIQVTLDNVGPACITDVIGHAHFLPNSYHRFMSERDGPATLRTGLSTFFMYTADSAQTAITSVKLVQWTTTPCF